MARFMITAVIAITMLLAASCSDAGGNLPSDPASATVTSASAAAEPTEESTGPARLGTALVSVDESGTAAIRVTALRVSRTAARKAPPPDASDARWLSAQARFCNLTSESTTVGWSPWLVVDDDAGQYPASSATYRGFPVPEYPFDRGVPAERCVRGWLVFEVTRGARITEVQYAPDDGDFVTWRVSVRA